MAYGASAAIANVRPEASAGKLFSHWTIGDTGRAYYPGDRLLYNTIDIVTGIGEGANNNTITITPVFADKPAVTGRLTFVSRGGSPVNPLSVTIPEGKERATYSIGVGGGKTTLTNIDNETLKYTIDNPARAGYTFAGWTDVESDTAAKDNLEVTLGPADRDRAKTLYAVWTVKRHRITFTGIGSEITIEDVAYGTPLDATAITGWPSYTVGESYPDKPHHTFGGWMPATAAMPDSDLTLTAEWAQIAYTIRFYDGDTEYAELKISDIYGAKIIPPDAPMKADEAFKGWHHERNNPSRLIESLPATMPDTNPTYYAVWKVPNGNTPDKPAAQAVDSTAIQVNGPDPALEYSYRKEGDPDTAWSDWMVPTHAASLRMHFTGLQPDTSYLVRSRYAETEEVKASDPSEACEVRTMKAPPAAPALTPGVGSLSVNAPDSALEYQCVDAARIARREPIDDAPWVSPGEGEMVFDRLEERHMYYVRARYKDQSVSPLPSSWTVEQTHKTMITRAWLEGEPVSGNTLKAYVDPAMKRDDVYYLWMRDGALICAQALTDKLEYFDEFQNVTRLSVVNAPRRGIFHRRRRDVADGRRVHRPEPCVGI